MRKGLSSFVVVAAASAGLASSEARVLIFPMGKTVTKDGRGPFILNDVAHAERVIEVTKRQLGICDLMFDYDHQVLGEHKAGSSAPAAGWCKPDQLEADAAGIWAKPDWTPAARDAINSREYRYLSPLFACDEKTGELLCLVNVALTNMPAMDLELPTAAGQSLGDQSNMKTIAAALGLAENATEEVVASTATALKAGLSSVALALGLAATATAAEIETAAKKAAAGGEPDPAKFVPVGELTALRARLDERDAKDAEAAVDAAIGAGKLTPANRDWALKAYKADPAGFAAMVGNQPAVITPGTGPTDEKVKVEALSQDQKALCAAHGWDEADYLKQLQAADQEKVA